MAQTSMHLHHYLGGSEASGVEHEPPRPLDSEMTDEEIEEQNELIRLLHFRRVGTREIHKALQTTEKRLGEKGKQMVSG